MLPCPACLIPVKLSSRLMEMSKTLSKSRTAHSSQKPRDVKQRLLPSLVKETDTPIHTWVQSCVVLSLIRAFVDFGNDVPEYQVSRN